jgi:hypothetical protein
MSSQSPKLEPAPPEPDDSELDKPSGVAICVNEKTGEQKELTFRELHAYTAKEIRLWDSLDARDRLTVQRHQDKNYKPLQPFDGLRSRRGRRGHRD